LAAPLVPHWAPEQLKVDRERRQSFGHEALALPPSGDEKQTVGMLKPDEYHPRQTSNLNVARSSFVRTSGRSTPIQRCFRRAPRVPIAAAMVNFIS
jgi:hypothetical protein